MRRLNDAMFAGDRVARDALVDPAFEWHERRRFAPESEFRWGETLDRNLSSWTDRMTAVEVEQIASRSDHLALFRNTFVLDDVAETVTILGVSRLGPNGLLVESTYFDDDQLDEARELLDQLASGWDDVGSPAIS